MTNLDHWCWHNCSQWEYYIEAVRIFEAAEVRVALPRLYRLRGELLIAVGDRPAAELSLCQTIAVARQQDAKLEELRTSANLARLWRDQGKRTEARELLAPIYGWFTEGFDTPDLTRRRRRCRRSLV